MTGKIMNFLVTVLVVLMLNVAGRAQSSGTPPKQADGVDFILLIDESGSMCGSRVHKGQNDPGNKRNAIIGMILPDILRSSTKGKCYRVSVIEFGSRYGSLPQWQAQVTLSAYGIPSRQPGENDDQYERRVKGELAYLLKPRSRGDSDHGQAVQLAREEIDKLNRSPVAIPVGYSGVERRLKVLFMLTDGKPYVIKQTGEGIHEVQLKRDIEQVIGNLKQGEAVLYVFGLNADDDYWFGQGYESFWKNVAATTNDNKGNKGDAQFITNQDQIYLQIAEILHRYTDAPPYRNLKYIDNKYDCPPYLKSVEFTIEFSRNYMNLAAALVVKDPNGQTIPNTYFRTDRSYALLKVEAPLHGTWIFDKKKPVKIYAKEEPQTAQYVSPVSPVPLNTSANVVFKMPDKAAGVPFVPWPAFPVEGQIIITRPDETEQVLNAGIDPQTPGHYSSAIPFQFSGLGLYKIRFSGRVVTASGEVPEVFSSVLQEITVINTQPVTVRLERPTSLASCFGSFRENLVFTFYSQQKPIAVDDILKAKPPIEVEVTLRQSSGKIKGTRVIPLKYEGGRLEGEVTGGIPARFYPELFLGKVAGNFTLKMDNRILKSDYFLEDPRTLTHLYEFERPVREAWWLYLFFFLILLGIFGSIAYRFFFKGKAQALSRDVPILIYRHGDKFNPDNSVEKKIEVFKRKMTFNKKVKTPFQIPGLTEQWFPELTVTRELIPMGTRVKVKYDRFLTNKEDPDRFEEITLETRDNSAPDHHNIRGLEEHDMIFELRIKEDRTKTTNK